MKIWSKNLNDVPAIENYDIMILYMYKSYIGMNGVLEITKSDNRYRLHQAKRIIDIRVPDTTYRFINI